MPRGDGTGPRGEGSMTGRAMGYCTGSQTPGFASGTPGRGRFPSNSIPRSNINNSGRFAGGGRGRGMAGNRRPSGPGRGNGRGRGRRR